MITASCFWEQADATFPNATWLDDSLELSEAGAHRLALAAGLDRYALIDDYAQPALVVGFTDTAVIVEISRDLSISRGHQAYYYAVTFPDLPSA